MADRRPDRPARHKRQPAHEHEQAGRGPRDLGEPGVRLRRPRGRLHTSERAHAPGNPYALSIGARVGGHLDRTSVGFLSVVKTPSARSDNLIFAYGEVPRSLELARRATRLMSGVVSTLEVNEERMRESLTSGFSQATDGEWVMQTCGVDYRTRLSGGRVGGSTRRRGLRGRRHRRDAGPRAEETHGRPPRAHGPRPVRGARPWGDRGRTRTSPGGAAPEVVREMAASVTDEASNLRAAVGEAAANARRRGKPSCSARRSGWRRRERALAHDVLDLGVSQQRVRHVAVRRWPDPSAPRSPLWEGSSAPRGGSDSDAVRRSRT